MQVSIERVTPEMAAVLLAKNAYNRPMKKVVWAKYASDMQGGRWKMNGETVVVSHTGELLDGQHRMKAILSTGLAQTMLVVRGVDASAFDTINAGAPRSAGDIIAIRGGSYSNSVVTTARLALNYVEGLAIKSARTRLEVSDFAASHEYLHELVAKIAGSGKSMIATGPLASVMFLANANRVRDTEVSQFLEKLFTGEGLMKGDPRLTLREWAISQRTKSANGIGTRLSFIAVSKAWSAFAEGRQMQFIKTKGAGSDGLPDILGYSLSTFVQHREAA